MKTRRKYNAIYRLRKKGLKINTQQKTIFTNYMFEPTKTIKILTTEFHYVIQTEIF